MREQDSLLRRNFDLKRLSRRNLISGAACAVAGAGLFRSNPAYAFRDDEDDKDHRLCGVANPIPGGVAPFKPFGVFIHHNPLMPANKTAVAGIHDPSQITDFDGFVGLTHIRGNGTGTNTKTGVNTALSYQADMGFSKGKFIGADGHKHEGALAFV